MKREEKMLVNQCKHTPPRLGIIGTGYHAFPIKTKYEMLWGWHSIRI